ncbi:succinate dehydrogenase cytochrome b subunit [Winogradskyella undariae]|uniref:succinate dehydrogenase cytochrome b subunit n=1 Tax=Winogradskyella TaxID=286104 RepID=UPI00156B06E7|nr:MULTISPECIES: succinate dehydrogenase cytochrome b subunit [Winogradskyella]NRR91268.1 succinate dehydrogenase cytochrome b subunit [Winogradskyella undariae]QXP80448.1 succinate dehydrogenase cytochrome b subunit [Winogradskyella sp. HaHa_3_26]
MSGILNSSIGRKIAMALSALFLIFFLIIHLAVNITSVFSADLFNELSHFMGTNPLVQFALQPVLVFGVIFHFVLGFVLEVRNRKAVGNISYKKNNGAANSSWMSRNMIYSGLAILAFIVLHFIDFWVPEINHKYIEVLPEDPTRYFGELQHKFVPIWRVIAYVVAFVFLSLHLMHGFTSSLQSMGVASSRKKFFKNFGLAYSIIIPLGFVIVALFHHFNH